MSYSAGSAADYFALVVGRSYGGQLFVRRVVRTHADLSVIEHEIRAAWETYGKCPVYTYYAGPERGAIQHLTLRGVPVQGMPARFNKDVRAQKTRAMWNAGRLLVPLGDEYGGFIRRARAFRGAEADADDEIDALVSLVDGVIGSGVASTRAFGSPRL
jgi:predicted phage terminase large subunit-like protein